MASIPHVVLRLIQWLVAVRAADILDLDETFVSTAQKTRAVYEVSPYYGTTLGGTRLSIVGEVRASISACIRGWCCRRPTPRRHCRRVRFPSDNVLASVGPHSTSTLRPASPAHSQGFATNHFDGSNSVAVGSDSHGYVACDVIEGACSVDCGSAWRVVCDTGAWFSDADVGALDVVLTIDESTETHVVTCAGCFRYRATSHASTPKLTRIAPRHAPAGGVLELRGEALGGSIDDYRNIYVGDGRPPQGGNIDTGDTNTHAICRPDALNLAIDEVTGEVDGDSLPVMAEDAIVGHGSPITADLVYCSLGEFEAGSYNVSAFLSTVARDGYGGLTANAATGLSRDANGVVHALQYFPTIASVVPVGGSLEGGTTLTIAGGGFPLDPADAVVTIGGVRCRVATSTLETITCVTGDLYPRDNKGLPEPHYVAEETWAKAAATGKYYIAYDEHSKRTFGGDRLARASLVVDNNATATRATARGPWRSVSLLAELTDVVERDYLVADACDSLACEPSWISFAPPNLTLAGVYEIAVHVPPFDAEAEGCSTRARNAAVLVRDAARGYVLHNVSMMGGGEEARGGGGWRLLGNFTLTAGAGPRHAAVVIDSLGADGCVIADAVRYVRVNASMAGGCTDPLAANYDLSAPLNGFDDGSQFSACLYVGGRGLTQRAWSMMAPEYRDGSWERNLDTRAPYDMSVGCTAPPLNSTGWIDKGCKDGYCGRHAPCLLDPETGASAGSAASAAALGAAGAFCCLTNDHWGCDPTWNSADPDGWVTVLKQDTDDALFEPDEWRKNAHGGAHGQRTFAILDDLEAMRNLETSQLELRLKWPGMEGLFEPMHWTQDVNPVTMWIEEAYSGEELDIKYACVSCPYYSYNYWGGLEYNNDQALLDGSVGNTNWFFAVGAIETHDDGIPGPYEHVDDDIGYYGALTQARSSYNNNTYQHKHATFLFLWRSGRARSAA